MMTEIGSLDPDGIMLEATAKFVKANCKDWKENNPKICMTHLYSKVEKPMIFD